MTNLLVVGDIHLGRRPSRVPQVLKDDWGVDLSRLNTASAWHLVVDEAIQRGVDAVLLVGGVVEQGNRFMEAYGPLEIGVRQLVAAGVRVIGVAGSQDVDILPRLAKDIKGFRLLGRDGRWELVSLKKNKQRALHLLGWSYPSRKVSTSPLDGLPPRPDDDLPVIGMLQCDLDRFGSNNAPVSSGQLAETYPDVWMLGLDSEPTLERTDQHYGYVGSLVGLSPRAYGRRGPWLVQARKRGDVRIGQLAMAPLRWERQEVPVEALLSPDDLEAALSRGLRQLHRSIEHELGTAEVVGTTMVLTGKTPFHRQIARRLAALDTTALTCRIDDRIFFVERVVDEAQPSLDLRALARGSDQPALLARHLLDLQTGSPRARPLIEQARTEMGAVTSQSIYQHLDPQPPDDTAMRALLIRAGHRTLEGLLAQAAEAR